MRAPGDVADLGVLDVARIIWRRRVSIVLLALIAAGAAAGFDAHRSPMYEANTQLLLTQPQLTTSAGGTTPSLNSGDVATAAKVIASSSTRQAAALLLHRTSIPTASVSPVSGTNVVQISVRSANPVLAEQAANGYASAYITAQRRQAVDSLTAAATQISQRIAVLGRQINTVQSKINNLASSGSTSSTGGATTSLRAEETNLRDQQSALQEQVTQLQANADLASGGGRIVNLASRPSNPVSPHPVRDAGLAALVGLVIGVGIAILREFLDDRIRSEADLHLALGPMTALGMVPVVPEWQRKRHHDADTHIIATTAPMSPAAEAYRSLRTSIQFVRLDQDVRAIVVTSPISGEGKTTVVANLADAMARLGQKVVVLSCDLRKPQLHTAFGVSDDVGFTSVLLGEVTATEALQKVPGYDDLWFMSAGPIPPNPAELLAGRRCEQLLHELRASADVVLIDTPPILPVTDAVVLAAKADAVLLVVAAGRTTTSQARQAIEILSRVDAAPMGVIANLMSHTSAGGYGYGYGYGYGGPRHSADARRPAPAPAPAPAPVSIHDQSHQSATPSTGWPDSVADDAGAVDLPVAYEVGTLFGVPESMTAERAIAVPADALVDVTRTATLPPSSIDESRASTVVGVDPYRLFDVSNHRIPQPAGEVTRDVASADPRPEQPPQ